jgi:hypothetical protein
VEIGWASGFPESQTLSIGLTPISVSSLKQRCGLRQGFSRHGLTIHKIAYRWNLLHAKSLIFSLPGMPFWPGLPKGIAQIAQIFAGHHDGEGYGPGWLGSR